MGQGGKWPHRRESEEENKARLARMKKLIDEKNAKLGVTKQEWESRCPLEEVWIGERSEGVVRGEGITSYYILLAWHRYWKVHGNV